MQKKLSPLERQMSTADMLSLFEGKRFLSPLEPIEDKTGLTRGQLLAFAFFRSLRSEVLENDKTLLITVEGRHRSGKSTDAACVSDLFDSSFKKYFDFRVVHSPGQFTAAVKVIRKEKIKGACIVVDEAGASFESGAWYTAWMKALQKTLIVCGYLNIIIFFCSTNRDFLDSKVRKISHQHWVVSRYNKDENIIKVYMSNYNTIMKKEYYPHPKINLFGQLITMDKIRFQRPPEELIARYKKIESPRKDNMMEDLDGEIMRSELVNKRASIDMNEVVKHVYDNYTSFTSPKSREGHELIDPSLVSYSFPLLKVNQIKYVKTMCEKKLHEDHKRRELADLDASIEHDGTGENSETVKKPYAKKRYTSD